MIRPKSVLLPALSLAALASLVNAVPVTAQVGVPPAEYQSEPARYTANQLDNLVGPIALYPDALLAQVLVASTFPDQVADAARYVRANGTNGIDDQPWDISVKAVAHYPSALNTMADKDDWTAALGVAYAYQSSDVMASIQRMRNLAAQQGNLVSNDQQQVVVDNNNYVIAPAQPRVIYVPVYDPVVIYTQPVFSVGMSSRYWSFGIGFPIGGWLSYDLDWRLRSVYYNGWNSSYIAYGGGWRIRSRPFIQITNIYVNPRYRNVYVNRDVGRRYINYGNVNRYGGYHRDTHFDNNRYDPRNPRGNPRGNPGGNNGRGDGRGNGSGDARGNDGGYTGRTAQPRTGQPRATPDGYQNGQRPDNRGSNSGVENRNGNQSGNRNGSNGAQSSPSTRSTPRPQVVAPEQRRAEPRQRPAERMIPTTRQTSPSRSVEPNRTPRQSPPSQPQARQPEARQPQARQAQPRQAQPRQSSPARGSGKVKPPTEGRG